jgi:hypothetical protein
VIFVKLWQFELSDRTPVRLRYDQMSVALMPERPGVSAIPLHHDLREDVRLEVWDAGAEIEVNDAGGIELLVLEGGFEDRSEQLREQSWLRVPIGGSIKAKAGSAGARVWIKTGHLRHVRHPEVT